MKQYIRTKLLKRANELAFKIELIKTPMKTVEDVKEMTKQTIVHRELVFICQDIIMLDNPKYILASNYGIKLKITLEILNNKIHHKVAKLSSNAIEVLYVLTELSDETYIVGGAVRDMLIDTIPKDVDFVTDTDMDIIIEKFKSLGYNVKEAGKAFKVIIVAKGNEQFEIANFRKDGVYLDGRRPESVEIGTIEEDAFRRDFTVNSLFWNHKHGLVDPTFQGIDDVISRTLRYIGKPEDRIQEDFLRVWRFYRFIQKGFTPAPKDLKSTRRLFNEVYKNIEPERVRLEIEKIVNI